MVRRSEVMSGLGVVLAVEVLVLNFERRKREGLGPVLFPSLGLV